MQLVKMEVAGKQRYIMQLGKMYTPTQWANYHHGMSRNPTAAVSLLCWKTVHDVQQSLSICDTTFDWQKYNFKHQML